MHCYSMKTNQMHKITVIVLYIHISTYFFHVLHISTYFFHVLHISTYFNFEYWFAVDLTKVLMSYDHMRNRIFSLYYSSILVFTYKFLKFKIWTTFVLNHKKYFVVKMYNITRFLSQKSEVFLLNFNNLKKYISTTF